MYKKAGVMVHDIGKIDQIQLNMFDRVDRDKRGNLMASYDAINNRMGRDTVRLAVQGFDKKMEDEARTPFSVLHDKND